MTTSFSPVLGDLTILGHPVSHGEKRLPLRNSAPELGQHNEEVLTSIGYTKEQQKRDQLKRAADANRRSVEMARQLYDRGLTAFLDVLEAQRNLFISEDALVQSEATVSTNLVALYKALGGGWEATNGENAATQPATTQPEAAPTTQP